MTEMQTGGAQGYLRIATEEAFMPPETIDFYGEVLDAPDPDPGFLSLWGFYLRSQAPRPKFIRDTLVGMGAGRLADMDARGIDRQIIALTSPGTQCLSRDKAIAFATLFARPFVGLRPNGRRWADADVLPYWPPSGRKSTYRPVQLCRATSVRALR